MAKVQRGNSRWFQIPPSYITVFSTAGSLRAARVVSLILFWNFTNQYWPTLSSLSLIKRKIFILLSISICPRNRVMLIDHVIRRRSVRKQVHFQYWKTFLIVFVTILMLIAFKENFQITLFYTSVFERMF